MTQPNAKKIAQDQWPVDINALTDAFNAKMGIFNAKRKSKSR